MTLQRESARKTEVFFTTDESAMLYECGFSCDNAILFRNYEELFFITDSRYSLEAREKCSPKTQIVESKDLIKDFIKIAQKVKNIAFDSCQISTDFYFQIKHLSLRFAPNFHQIKREIKSEDEISLIKESQKRNKEAFRRFAKFISENENLSEHALNFHAKGILQDFGANHLSFAPITAINANGAKPHALPSASVLKNGDLLLFDAGIKYKNYCSDMTRTAIFDGKIAFNKKQTLPPKMQKIYDIVLGAQERAIKGARSGMLAKEIDFLARDFIDKKGFGKFFSHSLGHGVGLDIHELPRISRKSNEKIEDGMVFSIEPGIYLECEFGVRIEDLVVMKNGKAEVL